MRDMQHKICILCLTALCLLLGGVTAFSQEDTVLKLEYFGQLQRPICVFDHDAHNEKAQLEDCAVCHHVYDNGVKVDGESSEGQACAECHALKPQKGQTGLRLAYHKQCKTCHVASRKGPVACGQCHVRK